MKSVLFYFFEIPVYSYPIFFGLGFLFALFLARKNATRLSLSVPQITDLWIVLLIAGIIGGKFGHVFIEAPSHLIEDPLHFLRLADSGYVFYGGLIGCLITAFFYFKNRPQINFWDYADALASPLFIGLAIGRLGCFFAGCCYGKATESFFGVIFPGHKQHVNPTQLYEMSASLMIGISAYLLLLKRKFSGQIILWSVLIYTVIRPIIEVLRGDDDRGVYFDFLSTSQIISVFIFAGCIWFLYKKNREVRNVNFNSNTGSENSQLKQ